MSLAFKAFDSLVQSDHRMISSFMMIILKCLNSVFFRTTAYVSKRCCLENSDQPCYTRKFVANKNAKKKFCALRRSEPHILGCTEQYQLDLMGYYNEPPAFRWQTQRSVEIRREVSMKPFFRDMRRIFTSSWCSTSWIFPWDTIWNDALT